MKTIIYGLNYCISKKKKIYILKSKFSDFPIELSFYLTHLRYFLKVHHAFMLNEKAHGMLQNENVGSLDLKNVVIFHFLCLWPPRS